MKYAVNRVTGDDEFLLKFYVHSVNVYILIFLLQLSSSNLFLHRIITAIVEEFLFLVSVVL